MEVCAIITFSLLVVPDILDREGGDQITIADVAMKEFIGTDPGQRVQNLEEIYGLLKHKKVPNVDHPVNAEPNADPPCVLLSPVGDSVMPSSGKEAFDSVVCVLEALKVR